MAAEPGWLLGGRLRLVLAAELGWLLGRLRPAELRWLRLVLAAEPGWYWPLNPAGCGWYWPAG